MGFLGSGLQNLHFQIFGHALPLGRKIFLPLTVKSSLMIKAYPRKKCKFCKPDPKNKIQEPTPISFLQKSTGNLKI